MTQESAARNQQEAPISRTPEAKIIAVANKNDLGTKSLGIENLQSISAKQNEGIELLKTSMVEAAGAYAFNEEDVIITNIRHVSALELALDFLMRAQESVNAGISSDLIAMDIRTSLRYLGEITGNVDVEELLGNIFSKFCIGK